MAAHPPRQSTPSLLFDQLCSNIVSQLPVHFKIPAVREACAHDDCRDMLACRVRLGLGFSQHKVCLEHRNAKPQSPCSLFLRGVPCACSQYPALTTVLPSESPHCYRFLPCELVCSKSFSRTCLGAWTLALDVPTSPELVNLTPSTSERARSDPTQSTFRDKRTGFAHRETESTTVRQPLGGGARSQSCAHIAFQSPFVSHTLSCTF